MTKIDTRIRHITKPSANIFAELGFAPDEARKLQTESLASLSTIAPASTPNTGAPLPQNSTALPL